MDYSTFVKEFNTAFATEEDIKRWEKNQGYVYLIHAIETNRYKIGRTVNPVARFAELKKQSPYPLKIVNSFWTPDSVKDEKDLHIGLGNIRVHGEWFEDNKSLEFGTYGMSIPNYFQIYNSSEISDLSYKVTILLFLSFNQGMGYDRKDYAKSPLSIAVNDLFCYCSSIKELQGCLEFVKKHLIETAYIETDIDRLYQYAEAAFKGIVEGMKIVKFIDTGSSK